jgi:hypothetical protein
MTKWETIVKSKKISSQIYFYISKRIKVYKKYLMVIYRAVQVQTWGIKLVKKPT